MNNSGTIYVLINPTMPGLIKIGKTKRHVQERIQELSSATGVPVQFMLVYEQMFLDVDAAESQVHTILEELGFRLSPNREFFNAPVVDAIKVIQTLDGKLTGPIPNKEEPIIDTSVENDEFGSLQNQKSDIDSQPWAIFWRKAENYYYGLQDEIQDHSEAMNYYAKSIKAGCPIAYIRMGEMYECGEGISRPDTTKALEFYKKGASIGDYYCYLKMAKLYIDDGNTENARKCVDRFATNREDNQKGIFEEERQIGEAVYDICYASFESDFISAAAKRYLSSLKDATVKIADSRIHHTIENATRYNPDFIKSYMEKLNKVRSYIIDM